MHHLSPPAGLLWFQGLNWLLGGLIPLCTGDRASQKKWGPTSSPWSKAGAEKRWSACPLCSYSLYLHRVHFSLLAPTLSHPLWNILTCTSPTQTIRLIFTPFTLSMVSSNTQLKSLSRNPSTHQEPKETTQKNCFAFNLIIDIVTSIKKSIYIFKWLGSSKPRILFLDR